VNEHQVTRFNHTQVIRFLKVVVLIAMVALLVQPVLAKEGNPGIARADNNPYGKTYNEWGAEWWKYVMSFPATTSPLNDATGANCAAGQSGPVFFLVGTPGGEATRDECVVPVGKSILFPILNGMCAVPDDGPTVAGMKKVCTDTFDLVDVATVTVDGREPDNLLDKYRFPSPIFSYTGAIDNPYDSAMTWCAPVCYEGFRESAFSDGYWVLLHPLPPGEHTISFTGAITDWGFRVAVTYNLTVANPAP
jgi:hypothetical protein